MPEEGQHYGWTGRFSHNPDIMAGEVCFAGTRVPVAKVMKLTKNFTGQDWQTFRDDNPDLPWDSIVVAHRLYKDMQS